MKISEAVADCAANLLNAGHVDLPDVVACVRRQHPDVVATEADRLVGEAIAKRAKDVFRSMGAHGPAEQAAATPLPGFPRDIAVPKPSGGWYYVSILAADRAELDACREQRRASIRRDEDALRRLDELASAAAPVWDSDPAATVSECLDRLSLWGRWAA